MLETYIYTIASVLIISLISVIVAIPFIIKKKVPNNFLIFLLSLSVGVLLATVFFDFLPEIYENENSFNATVYLLVGFLVMFILEKFIHYSHTSGCGEKDHGHSHAYNVAPVNIIGDGVHNFIDGLIIAGSYIISIPIGIAATISIAFHEIPQEIADFGVFLYSGLSKKKAILFNLLSSLTAIIGAIIGLSLAASFDGFSIIIIPFAAGNFLYIASSNLLPQLHRHCGIKETFFHLLAIILGIILIIFIGTLFPHA